MIDSDAKPMNLEAARQIIAELRSALDDIAFERDMALARVAELERLLQGRSTVYDLDAASAESPHPGGGQESISNPVSDMPKGEHPEAGDTTSDDNAKR